MAKHHYVPRFLLERFADERDTKRQVWALDNASGRPFKTNPRNLAAVSDFYTQDGEPEDAAEEALARLEAHGAALIARLVAGEEISDQERADLAVFVGQTHMRTPLGRQWLKDGGAPLWDRRFVVPPLGPRGFDPSCSALEPVVRVVRIASRVVGEEPTPSLLG